MASMGSREKRSSTTSAAREPRPEPSGRGERSGVARKGSLDGSGRRGRGVMGSCGEDDDNILGVEGLAVMLADELMGGMLPPAHVDVAMVGVWIGRATAVMVAVADMVEV
jgi:hypothetical protein